MKDFQEQVPGGHGHKRGRAVLAGLLVSFLLLGLVGYGCSGSGTAQALADPANQLPHHINWGSYNLYRYQPGTEGGWVRIVNLGVLEESPLLGDRPVLMTHGWGGSIRNNRMASLAQDLFDHGLASSVFGFEYDSQDGILANGVFYRQALDLLSSFGPGALNWTTISHSMGGLVARAALQGDSLPIAATGNRFITLGTPHLGTPVADAVQGADAATQSLVLFHLDQGGFMNSDGNPSEVDLDSQGLTDLRTDSEFLANLNLTIGIHPQARFFTLAGTELGSMEQVNIALGVTTDDGLVTLESANPIEIVAAGSGTAPVTHTELPSDQTTVFPLIRQFMVQ